MIGMVMGFNTKTGSPERLLSALEASRKSGVGSPDHREQIEKREWFVAEKHAAQADAEREKNTADRLREELKTAVIAYRQAVDVQNRLGSDLAQLRAEQQQLIALGNKFRSGDVGLCEIVSPAQFVEMLLVKLAERQIDTTRLDWLEANYDRINMIEPPDAFPPPADHWVLWDAIEEAEVLGAGQTLRAAIDAAIESRQHPTPDSHEPSVAKLGFTGLTNES